MRLEEAIDIAKASGCKFNACSEYEKGFHFFDKDSDADGDAGVVVVKETGDAINFVTFLLDYAPEVTPKKVEIRKVKRG